MNEIMPPQPYYIPGYTGYCPQVKYRIGKNRSKESHLVLLDQNVAHSDKTVLANTNFGTGQQSKNWGQHCESTRCVYHSAFVPGYTGYVPRNQHFFGITQGRARMYALAGFKVETERIRQYHKKLQSIACDTTKLVPLLKITPSVVASIKAKYN